MMEIHQRRYTVSSSLGDGEKIFFFCFQKYDRQALLTIQGRIMWDRGPAALIAFRGPTKISPSGAPPTVPGAPKALAGPQKTALDREAAVTK